MSTKWIVECFKNGWCKKRRSFATAAQAVKFANDWHDNHEDNWDVQIITPSGRIHQTNTNGNTRLDSIVGAER